MTGALIFLDPDSPLSLQNQIREKLVELIVSGAVPVGTRLPSIRGLAEQLQVSRNTVVLAYQQLLAEGFLITRERSGIYPNPAIVSEKLGTTAGPQQARGAIDWASRIQAGGTARKQGKPSDCDHGPGDSFLDGSIDPSLYPLAEWREVTRLALASREVREWSTRSVDLDDPMLIE